MTAPDTGADDSFPPPAAAAAAAAAVASPGDTESEGLGGAEEDEGRAAGGSDGEGELPAPHSDGDDAGGSSHDDGEDDDDDDDDDDVGEAYESSDEETAASYLALLMPQQGSDADCAVLTAGAVGFVVALLVAAVLPVLGIQRDYVLASGMFSLLGYIAATSFCPTCPCCRAAARASAKLSPIESITPRSVFIVMACFGTMFGGIIGGGLQFMYPSLRTTLG